LIPGAGEAWRGAGFIDDQTSATIPSTVRCPIDDDGAALDCGRKSEELQKHSMARWRGTVQGLLGFAETGRGDFGLRQQHSNVAFEQGVKNAYDFPGFCAGVHPAIILRRQGPVPGGRRFRERRRILRRTDQLVLEMFRTTSTWRFGSSWPQKRVKFQGLPSRIWLAGIR